MYVFDLQGTLVGNPQLRDEDVPKMLMALRARGHRLVIMTGNVGGVPKHLAELVDECWYKPLPMEQVRTFNASVTIFDDDAAMLRCMARAGAKVVAANQMGAWFANEDWDNGHRG